MKTSVLREMTIDELNTKLSELKTELFNLRLKHAIQQLTNPVQLNLVKKDIARVKTVLRQRELKGENINVAPVAVKTAKSGSSKTK